jgi:hypothetical protein
MEKERLELMESVERKRRERKERERERRRREETGTGPRPPPSGPSTPLPPGGRPEATPERGRARLREDGEGPRGGRLKRSFSSPNIAQMLEQVAAIVASLLHLLTP